MRTLFLFLVSSSALAHPGHGKPDFIHFHEFSDGLLIGIGLVIAALAAWAWKK
ncbi:MAG TPA: hypothetical protein VFU24_05625 [Burkholderiales bacterium]|nr:hypothetical protein [Burkholderiales bacterium]